MIEAPEIEDGREQIQRPTETEILDLGRFWFGVDADKKRARKTIAPFYRIYVV